MNEDTSPEFEERLKDLLAAPDADAAFVSGLRSKLGGPIPARRGSLVLLRLAWATAIALALLAVGLAAFSPQVAQAMRRLLGYIPGVGYVEKGPALRVLSRPVTYKKDGLTVTIEQGAVDSQRTVLLARVDGYPKEQSGPPSCTDRLQLVSAEGTTLWATGVASSSDGESGSVVFVRYEFEPMPASSLDATLDIPCLLSDAGYTSWSIPLHFKASAPTDEVVPVIELPTPVTGEGAPAGSLTPAGESPPAGFSIVLRNVAVLKDGYVLAGSYRWTDPRIDRYAVAISHSNIVDATGQDVPYQEVEADPSADSNPGEIPFAYQITGKDFAWPMTLVVSTISVVQPGQATFEFDAGPNPQVGQTWDVGLDVPVGQHVVHVETIQLKGGAPYPEAMLGFEFTMTSDPAVASATVHDAQPLDCKNGCGGGGGGGTDFGVSGFDGATAPFVNGWVAQGYSPAGVKTFVISDLSVFFRGPWQVSWQPSTP